MHEILFSVIVPLYVETNPYKAEATELKELQVTSATGTC